MKKIVSSLVCWAIIFVLSGISSAAEKIFYYHTDQAGTPLAMTDESGNVVWKADYKPFGEVQGINPTAIENNEKFVGKERDKETDLYYFGARYMQDKSGRFMSPDPIAVYDPITGGFNEKILMNPQRLNPYAYALNNPYAYVDHDGNFAFLLAPIAIPFLEALGYTVLGLTTFKVLEQAYHNHRDGILNEGNSEEGSSSGEKGRSAGKLAPVPDAEGPHSVAKRDPKTGKVKKYETYRPQSNPNNPNEWESEKRYDSEGAPHYNKHTGQKVPTPHVHDPQTPGGVREPQSGEIP